MIIIKKYPNRRLYDTVNSQYVNLSYIKELINAHSEFQIVDSKTGDDLTKSVLLQIITESESNDQQSLLTDVLLKQLIRFYDSDMEQYVRQYLEQSLVQFMEQQEKVQGLMKNMVDSNPMTMFTKMMEQNLAAWSYDKSRNKE
ncbi:polyhydroxyalkanoate synthesis repressor PhaR [Glaciecola petra]|uniref:Polyhydroxyalkanoate synthesis repressor PhaR n=1 Tax=Glaciecola petra TaxID=3075602 RepID=A0ABU2ZSJ5_9ALTE|nr:polyhydroxyalkanoate synthesis repressor PhaR [Aestuariibacter sp. P117]MDT0595605.1 polyhydroxyalkanoate synthesis repressor PhaR [Aestuariibacter sp. P117]